LVHDDDQVVAAAAIHFIVHRRLWALSDDIEYVITHRPADDVAVVEAAAWALLQRRQPAPPADAAGDTLLAGALPAVELADRVRTIPLFQYVSVDELFRIADVGEEIRYPAGRELYRSGATAAGVEFVLAGTTAAEGVEITAPAVVGLDEVLSGAPAPSGIRAVGPVTCFRIAAGDFLTMLSDNVLLAQGLFRMLLAPDRENPPLMLPAHPPDMALRSPSPQAVDIAMLLRHHPLFERASAAQLLALTGAATEIPLAAGAALLGAGDMPAILVILTGEVVLESNSAAPIIVPPGTTLGVAETLAGVGSVFSATVTKPGRALRLERERLFSVLGDEVELMQGLFSGALKLRAAKVETLP
jgi:CRP-like cAMP-binding protein